VVSADRNDDTSIIIDSGGGLQLGAKPEPRQMEAPAFQNSTARRRQNPIRNRLARPSDTPPKGAIPSKTVSPRSATRPISATSNWCHPSS
jgi:hypothetical protein